MIARRKEGDTFGGLWEFPGGKLMRGETPEQCLERELQEEMGVDTRTGSYICSSLYSSPALSVELLAYRVTWISGEFMPKDHQEIKWVEVKEIDSYEFAPPDILVVKKVKELGPFLET